MTSIAPTAEARRSPVLTLLDKYEAAWPAEAAVVQQIRTLVLDHADCFDRTCRPGHLTGSAWVVSADAARHLLLHHRKLDKWLQPGGHADGDPDLAAVALREAAEETNLAGLEVLRGKPTLLDVDVHLIPARYDAAGELLEDAHEHHDLRFLIRAGGNETLVGNEESNALRWCTPTEVRALTNEPSVLRLLDKSADRLAVK
ncbi:NUDIX hydrolase [Botrimarina hoheduenensis]|uniref:Diadenosine hexaphosphate hydrolase n=1 Tax=Botrimarina hoheduenensis TaxID=2528000 RepID=A0A5C5W7C5_9BACT|nr:NUDIX hydrolase [Botrimarina hoheduenensis]TWT46514.1 Diadenosine hexaphosphate hydrolase [Botrimarina hoheduenensis]